jgi:hypothetical protein
MTQILTSKNFLLYAAQHYDNPQCQSTEEFEDDLRRIKYIKKLITKYIEKGELKDRLILNHIIILSNVFKPVPLCRILYLKVEDYMMYVKPFLMFIGVWQERLYNIKKEGVIDTSVIPMDQNIINVLRKI